MNPEQYLRLVQHDLDTLALLAKAADGRTPPEDVSDWKCTLMFYMACVYVKALARSRQKDLQDHYNLRQWLNTTKDLLAITKPYRRLEERSRDARYEGRRFSCQELGQARSWFLEVRDHLVQLLESGGVKAAPGVDPGPHL